MEVWSLNRSAPEILSLITTWHILNEHNSTIFKGKQPSITTVVFKILGALTKKPRDSNSQGLRIKPFFIFQGYTMAFFDGAVEAGGSRCGAGGTLKCTEAPDYS
jgi:hypothetical protein